MMAIKIDRQVSADRLDALGVYNWPTWQKEISEFPWTYDVAETCYIIEGEVTVRLEDGTEFVMGSGDLVTFPAGLACVWCVKQPLKKYYSFS